MLRKTNAEGYSKDVSTGVIVNNNTNDYAVYMQNRERTKQLKTLQREIETIRHECAELRTLFKELDEKINVKNNI